MQVVGAGSSEKHAPVARLRQRLRVIFATLATVATGAILLLPDASTTPVSAGIEATSTTIYGPVFPLLQFPVQGKCSFIDTFGAGRSGGRAHEGVDLIAKTGQFVYAVTDGSLTKQYVDEPGSLSGNGWRLSTSDGTYFFYAHLSAFAPGLKVGSKVVAGQIIGYVGMTGNAGTPHLHFEIHPGGGAAINPTPSVKAIDACNVTAVPPVATNPTIPGQTTKPAVTSIPLAPAVRVSLTTTTTAAATPSTLSTAPSTTAPATTVPPTSTTAPPSNSSQPSGGGKWQFIEPVVVYNGTSATSLQPGVTKKVSLSGIAGIAATTSAVLVRVSATVGSAGSVVVHPCDSVPVATTIFAEAGPMAIGVTPVAVTNGAICVTSNTSASAKLTVVGQRVNSGSGVNPIPATRVFDSRETGGLTANQSVTVPVSAVGGSATRAVSVTVTIVGPTADGTLSIGGCGGTALKAPFPKAPLFAFSAIVPVGASGVCVSSSVAADVVLDIDGQWRADAGDIAPVTPTRMFDSRNAGAAVASTAMQVSVAGVAGAPAVIGQALVNLTVLGGAGGGSVFAFPCGTPQPAAAVGVVAANKRATFSVVTSAPGGLFCVASNQPVDLLVDVVALG